MFIVPQLFHIPLINIEIFEIKNSTNPVIIIAMASGTNWEEF